MKKAFLSLAVSFGFVLLLLFVGLVAAPSSHRGDCGYRCKNDGSCNWPLLECRAGIKYLDEPTCMPKEKP